MSAELDGYLLEVVLAYAATALIAGGITALSVLQAARAAKMEAEEPDDETS